MILNLCSQLMRLHLTQVINLPVVKVKLICIIYIIIIIEIMNMIVIQRVEFKIL
jgi:hypothetical protein